MKRLILCSAVTTSLIFLAACSGDPTDSLRGGVEKLNPTPSQMFLVQGKTGTVVVSATDGQGNQIETSFELTNTGPGISVERDPTFRPVYVNDTLLGPPERDACSATGSRPTRSCRAASRSPPRALMWWYR